MADTALLPELEDAAWMAFDVLPRTRLVFGPGTVGQVGLLASEMGCRRALIVTDAGILAAGHVQRAEASLRAAGLEVRIHAEVRENPTTLDVEKCRSVAEAMSNDLFIGLGGGSSMDTAKGANFILTNGGQMRDYWGVGKATRPMLPLIAIPTTAGTGSECQSAALIADEDTHQKMACLDPKAAARVAVLDPDLTLSQPARVTAVTGMDALAHALETGVCRKRTSLSRMYSQEAFRLCAGAFGRVLQDPGDREARGSMLLGAALAGCAIEASMLGAAHAAANPLTARFGVVHGEAVGLMLPHVIRFNARHGAAARAYADLARGAGWAGSHLTVQAAVEALLEGVDRLQAVAGLCRDLGSVGVSAQDLAGLAQEAATQWTARFNPIDIGPGDFLGLYRNALDGPA
jgi:alcohol dehydrogenase